MLGNRGARREKQSGMDTKDRRDKRLGTYAAANTLSQRPGLGSAQRPCVRLSGWVCSSAKAAIVTGQGPCSSTRLAGVRVPPFPEFAWWQWGMTCDPASVWEQCGHTRRLVAGLPYTSPCSPCSRVRRWPRHPPSPQGDYGWLLMIFPAPSPPLCPWEIAFFA